MADLTSRPFRPDPAKACSRCCFGAGEHAPWCPPEHSFYRFFLVSERDLKNAEIARAIDDHGVRWYPDNRQSA